MPPLKCEQPLPFFVIVSHYSQVYEKGKEETHTLNQAGEDDSALV